MDANKIKTYAISRLVREVKQVGIDLTGEYRDKLTNNWFVPYLLGKIESFDPSASLENQDIDYSKGEDESLEALLDKNISR